MADDAASLDDLRAAIDRVDTAMHDLLMERTALTERIAAYKNAHAPDRGKMRPAREANILRKLVARHDGQLPAEVVGRIWREIMAAVVHMQDPVEIQVAAREHAAGYWELAKSHFGIQAHKLVDSAEDVLAAVRRDPTVVGVLPAPDDGEAAPWWPQIAAGEAPKVFARLPFIDGPRKRLQALAIGHVVLESSGDDLTWLVLETREELGRSRLTEWCGQAGLTARVLAGPAPKGAQFYHYLVEIDGCLMPDDPAIETVKEAGGAVLTGVSHIGTFARPIRIEGV